MNNTEKLLQDFVLKPASGKEITEQFGHYCKGICGYVFLPSGDGYFILDEENTKD